jgi:hypothetical protein
VAYADLLVSAGNVNSKNIFSSFVFLNLVKAKGISVLTIAIMSLTAKYMNMRKRIGPTKMRTVVCVGESCGSGKVVKK